MSINLGIDFRISLLKEKIKSMINNYLKYVMYFLIVVLSILVVIELTTPMFIDFDSVDLVREKFSKTLNAELKTNKDLGYGVTVIGMKSNELVIVSVLENKINYNSDSSSYERRVIDTTFYLCTHKHYWSDYNITKISLEKNSNIWNYIYENKFLKMRSLF